MRLLLLLLLVSCGAPQKLLLVPQYTKLSEKVDNAISKAQAKKLSSERRVELALDKLLIQEAKLTGYLVVIESGNVEQILRILPVITYSRIEDALSSVEKEKYTIFDSQGNLICTNQ